jgi:hypothetical protein
VKKGKLTPLAVHELLKAHQDPPQVSFFFFSRLILTGPRDFVATPAGMFGALDLDTALEACTRQFPPGRPVLLRLEMILPNPP